MKINLLIFFYFFTIYSVYSQNVTISGRIVDKENKHPLMYGSIEIKSLSTGTYSDTNGLFKFIIPQKNIYDTIVFNALGFECKKMIANELISNIENIVELNQKIFEIEAVVVKPRKAKVLTLGIKEKKPWKYQIASVFGGQYGIYIENKRKAAGMIKKVSFYIAEVGHTNAPFRIRIYSVNNDRKCPGEDILTENVIVQNNSGVGWFSVDLQSQNIAFPENGVFIMMEWLYSGDKYYYTREGTKLLDDGVTKQKVVGKFYGPSLGNVNKQSEILMWSRGLGEEWIKWDFDYKGYISVMINAEVEFFI